MNNFSYHLNLFGTQWNRIAKNLKRFFENYFDEIFHFQSNSTEKKTQENFDIYFIYKCSFLLFSQRLTEQKPLQKKVGA